MATFREAVDAMALVLGDAPVVAVMNGAADLYDAAIKERDEAKASEAAAKAALEAAKADAAATAAKLSAIFEDLKDGIYDGALPSTDAPVTEPAPAQ